MEIQALVSGCSEYVLSPVDLRTPEISLEEYTSTRISYKPGWQLRTCAYTFVICTQKMAKNPETQTLAFHGERVTWISPGTLKDLLELKAKHPEAPLILGNTSLGE